MTITSASIVPIIHQDYVLLDVALSTGDQHVTV
jgi:hypothetical protein